MIDEERWEITPKGLAYLHHLRTASSPNADSFNAGYDAGYRDGAGGARQPYSPLDCDPGCTCTERAVDE